MQHLSSGMLPLVLRRSETFIVVGLGTSISLLHSSGGSLRGIAGATPEAHVSGKLASCQLGRMLPALPLSIGSVTCTMLILLMTALQNERSRALSSACVPCGAGPIQP